MPKRPNGIHAGNKLKIRLRELTGINAAPSAIPTIKMADGRLSLRNGCERTAFMQALIFQGLGKKALEERPKPTIAEPADAIVKITKTTICGTDLHILKGDVPTCQPGRVLGHEGVGFIEAVGPGVATFKSGERVLISCISACGKCEYCRKY